jgi:plasmid maintenance system antidote protein VapI
VPPNRIAAILEGQKDITGDTAVRLGIKTSAEFRTNRQMTYGVRNEKALPALVRKSIASQNRKGRS